MSNYSSKTNPGGATTELQYNNNGAFDGVTELTWDDAAKILQLFGSTAVVQRASGQSTNLTEWQDSLGVASATVNADGEFTNTKSFAQSECFGDGATAVNITATAVGYGASSERDGVAVGNLSSTTARFGVAIGSNATAAGQNGVAIGPSVTAATNGTVVGT